jgi:hypothetical protein
VVWFIIINKERNQICLGSMVFRELFKNNVILPLFVRENHRSLGFYRQGEN